MHTPTDRCIACHEGGSPHYTFYGTMYWVCSQDCLDQLCQEIPDIAARLIPLWRSEVEEGARAYDQNEARVKAEAHVEFEKMLERERKEREKQEAAEMREQERKEEAERKRLERQELERQRQEAADKRELERREYQEQKERAKQEEIERKEWEEEQLRQEDEAAREEMLKEKPIPPELRREHVHVLGPSGSGKTTLLQNNLLSDFLIAGKINPNPPALIVIDPKGLMIERLSRLQLFAGAYRDRIVIVDPFDKPALNLFKTLGRDPAQLISDFSYIFSTTKQKLTGKQTTCFSYCARLLFTLPDANLITLLDLLDDRKTNPTFQQAIPKLSPIERRFFEHDYYAPNYASTREEIKARVYGVAQNNHLAAMFNANTRKLDLAQCVRERKIVLVNTRMIQLKEDHQTLGRYIITLVQDAIQSRTERHPVYLVIDEFQEFADAEKTPSLLRLLREYGGGAVIAHQNMYCAELDEATRAAISTNTSIKYASNPEGQDLGYMARDLRCEPEFLKEQQRSKTHARFACYARNMEPPLKHPFIVRSQIGWIEKWPKMNDEAHQALRARNKAMLQDDPMPPTHKPPHSEGVVSKAIESAKPRDSYPRAGSAETDKKIIEPRRDPSKIAKWTPPS